MKKQIDEILRRIEAGKATDDEMRMADQHLSAMEERLSSQIDDWASQEQKSKRQQRRVWLRHAMAAAACLLLLVSVTVWFTNNQQKGGKNEVPENCSNSIVRGIDLSISGRVCNAGTDDQRTG